MDITYREIGVARLEDAITLRQACHQFHVTLKPGKYQEASREEVACKYNFGVLAYEGDTPIGIADGYILGDSALRLMPVAVLCNLFTDERYREVGVGSELLRRFKTLARIKGARIVRIGIESSNKNAIKFYSIRGAQQEEIVMELSI